MNQLERLYNDEFYNDFVRIGYIELMGHNTVFCDVFAYMDDKFIYINNGRYRMMYPVTSIKKIVLGNYDIE